MRIVREISLRWTLMCVLLSCSALAHPQLISSFQAASEDDGQKAGKIHSVFIDRDLLYLGTSFGLLVSMNRGHSFERIGLEGLPNAEIKNVRVSKKRIHVKSCGERYLSEDGGESFRKVSEDYEDFGWEDFINNVMWFVNEEETSNETPFSITVEHDGEVQEFPLSVMKLPDTDIRGFHQEGDFICIATFFGISISEDGGRNFTQRSINILNDDL